MDTTTNVIDYDDFVCMYPCSAYVHEFKRGEVVKLNEISSTTESDIVWFTDDRFVSLEVFKFCFIWKGDWKGDL